MIALEFPESPFRTKTEEGKTYIFDDIRKKFVFLSPEEWVRQNMIRYLVIVLGYPRTLLSVEKEIRLGELKKRCDVVVYDRRSQPWMIVECKEMNVPISQMVLDQSIRYHMALPVKFLVMTNGANTFCIRIGGENGHQFCEGLPGFG